MVRELGKSPRLSPSRLKSLWQRWQEPSPLVTEESIPLRILVQALVLVGIAATDAVAGTRNSLWAIPLSVAGAVWSYHRRRERNLGAKFLLAIAMIAVLVAFLGRLVQQADTRLLLAQLLIQLQALHSFDLPRRRDLGYSTVIGLILLGVAGTLSETLDFGLWLLLFLVLALPVLLLDYRSRLGLASPLPSWRAGTGAGRRVSSLAGSSLRQLAAVLLGALLLGLVIFATLPRLPGFQLRSLPVSAPIEFQGEFDGTRIRNPGYADDEALDAQGSGDSLGPGGQNQATGPGRFNSEFYYGFNSRMNQNLRGTLQPRIVLRVRSQAEAFWRVLGFDRYTGQGWEVSREQRTFTLDRPSWTSQFVLPPTESTVFPPGASQEVIQSYTLAAELPNLVPAAAVPSRIYFPTRKLAVDVEGSLRSPVTLPEGLTYTVISNLPYRNRTALNRTPQVYPDRIRNYYLQLPERTPVARIRAQAEAILAMSAQPLSTAYEKTLYLAQHLKQRYTLQPQLPFFSAQEDVAEAFLFKYEGGYPDHFGTTLAVMLRALGIPCRLAAGFGPGQFNPFTGFYVVRNTDAYALVEVYFPGMGWFSFDPIPGHDLFPASVDRDETFGPLRLLWRWVAGWLPSPLLDFLSNLVAELSGGLGRLLSGLLLLLTGLGWGGTVSGVLVLAGVGLAGWGLWLGLGWLRVQTRLRRLAPVERVYQQMVLWLTARGLPKRPSQTPREYAAAVRRDRPAQAEPVEAICRAYTDWRYGQQQPSLSALRQQLRQLQRQR